MMQPNTFHFSHKKNNKKQNKQNQKANMHDYLNIRTFFWVVDRELRKKNEFVHIKIIKLWQCSILS